MSTGGSGNRAVLSGDRADARRRALDDGVQLETPRDAVRWLDDHCPTVARIIRAHLAQQQRDLEAARSEARNLHSVIRDLDAWIAQHDT